MLEDYNIENDGPAQNELPLLCDSNSTPYIQVEIPKHTISQSFYGETNHQILAFFAKSHLVDLKLPTHD